MNRRIVRVGQSVLRIDQRIRLARSEIGTDVSGPACIYAQVEVWKGTVVYLHGEAQLAAPKRFAIFLPPFAVVQARLDACDLATLSLAFRPPVPSTLPQRPLLLSANAAHSPTSVDEVLGRLHAGTGAVDIGRAPDPSLLALKAKTILDAEYRSPLAIGHIAKRLHASPETLSRTFKDAYGMPPVRYRHHVRIMDALMQFAEGAVPADVFLDVGFDDLSRFYKVFRKVACAAPGAYRPTRSKNAKT